MAKTPSKPLEIKKKQKNFKMANKTSTAADAANDEQRHKRSIGLEKFGQRKGHVRALEEFHNRKMRKQLETAKALRKYKKVMKGEGYEAAQGASRKRLPTSDTTSSSDQKVEENEATTSTTTTEPSKDAITTEDQENKTGNRSKSHRQRPVKSNPFQKSIEKGQAKRDAIAKAMEDREKNEKERKKRLRERKERSKLLAKRTKRGQPIMKYTVENMLAKLQRQQQQQG